VTDAEMQGAPVGSQEFTNSASVSSLSGILYNSKNDSILFGGNLNPWTFGISFFDFGRSTELFVRVVTFPIGDMAGTISEKPFSGAEMYYETGHWTYSSVPEPSSLSLLAVAAVLALRRCKASEL